MIKLRNVFYFLVLGCTFLLSGCHYAILDPKGIIAATEKKLLIESVLLMLIVVVPVIFLSIIIPWRYRASNTKATYKPNWSHSTMMEIVWWSIPCAIIFVLSWMTWVYTHSLDPYRPLAADQDTIMIEAVALDWKWLFIYPQTHTATINLVEIPVNKAVRFFITSDAPMNSLEIPQLAGQIYAMTGMQTKLNLMATSTGNFVGLSTNYSGDGFSGMNFPVKVVTQSQYNNWIKTVSQSPNHLTLAAYNEVIKPSKNNPITYFSHVEPGLFSQAIIKYMGPMPGMALGYTGVLQDEKNHQG
ncbi:MAG: ubiquinol oxidase subunit II [Gammaproteobacteria bacterium CG_4_10_14_0_8_um_filter_38_16]|nr:MAG: ubiquinol oxidase subunit II [Gammaproteobacteria bacterium CG_4_10_14_0_8_um_filter_38_16]PJA02719.1 MAG: ubiquinol oxidase subunit II [Gammaproteobacteria bacterium CG_4_10_14_0_2_um_filter_38_22]PJB09797.1 MAG: ubiquinol oxidase subunit II [Gammaproteobacteria bacterium CG_4_9_14_3_um_filter_38_9]